MDVCCGASHGVHCVLVPGAIPPYVMVAQQIGQHAGSQLHSNGAFSSRMAVALSHSMGDGRICRDIPKECFERIRILFCGNGDCRNLCHRIGSRYCCSPPIFRSGYRILMRRPMTDIFFRIPVRQLDCDETESPKPHRYQSRGDPSVLGEIFSPEAGGEGQH